MYLTSSTTKYVGRMVTVSTITNLNCLVKYD